MRDADKDTDAIEEIRRLVAEQAKQPRRNFEYRRLNDGIPWQERQDAESDTIKRIAVEMRNLTPVDQQRVLNYLNDRFGLKGV